VTPLLLVGLGALAFVGGVAVVRSFGRAGRIGRLLAGGRRVRIAEAIAMAGSGDAPYVRIDGRIDSEEEFEDEAHRPLVLRLSRVEIAREGGWTAVDTVREVVPFTVRDGPDEIAVDGAVLDEGLVVVPREAAGRATDVPERIPAGTPSETPVRLVVRQVSSVEHATVVGVPAIDAHGRPYIGAGRGRPLVLTTLETDEALRLLGGGRRVRSALAIALLGLGVTIVVVGIVWALLAAATLGATPTPAPTPAAGDPRSAGEGPGLVGEPFMAVIAVLAVGIATAVLTLAWVRLRPARSATRR
jgi:hypothetical protein